MRRVLLLLPLLGVAAAPPSRPAVEQRQALQRRAALLVDCQKDQAAGRLDRALDALRRALAISREVYGPWHPVPADDLHHLGKLAEAGGRFDESIATFRELLAVRARVHGPGNWRTTDARWLLRDARQMPTRTAAERRQLDEADQLNDEAVALSRQGRPRDALKAAQRALELREKLLGERHPYTANTLNTLACLRANLGDARIAVPLHERALKLRRELLGEDHPDYAASLNNLADAHRRLGDYPAALTLYRRALAVPAGRESAEDRAIGLNNLAALLGQMGDHKAALPLHREALALRKEALGERHRDYAQSLDNLAVCLAALGDVKAALPLAHEALSVRRTVLSRTHLACADSLINLAALYRTMGDPGAALPLAEEALAIREKALSRRHPACAQALNNLAGLHQDRGDYRAALPLYQKARAVWRDTLGTRHPEYAAVLSNLALLHHVMGDDRSARPLAEQAVALRRSVLGDRHPLYAVSLNNLALIRNALGEPGAAVELARHALSARRAAHGTRHPAYARGLGNLAAVLEAAGEYREALEQSRAALALIRATLGERHPDHALALNNLATLYQTTGDLRAAVPLLEKAVVLRKELLGEAHPDHATALNNLAMLRADLGNHRTGLTLARRAQELRKKSLPERHPDHARSLNNLAALHLRMGDRRTALTLYEKALPLLRESVGEKHPDHARTLHNLASLHQRAGDLRTALPAARQALAIWRGTLGERHPTTGHGLNTLASIHRALGEHDRALALYREAEQLTRERLGEKHHRYAVALGNLALCLSDAGDRRAGPMLRRAADITRAALGRMHPEYAAVLRHVARHHRADGRPLEALALAEEAAQVVRYHLDLNAGVQSERQQLRAAEDAASALHLRLSLPDVSASASHDHVLVWKGAVFSAQLQRRLLRKVADAGDAETRERIARLERAAGQIAAMARGSGTAWRARLEELTREKEEQEAWLAARSEAFRARHVTTAQVRDALPADAALIDFLAYEHFDPARTETRLAAWVLRRGSAVLRLDLGPLRPIEADLSAWRSALAKGDDAPEAAARLRRRVWAPLEKHLAGATTVLISPDGALGKLPFAALPGTKKGTYLIEDVGLAVVPVPALLARPVARPGGGRSLLAVGDVDFGVGRRWSALPATRPEAEAVAAAIGKGTVERLRGAAASRSAVRAALPKARFVHLATHGYFTGGEPDAASGIHPGLLSGLVLAGANRPTEKDDGVLTALEIAELDLSGVELAVLSACETGLGKEEAGEGLLGLQRAFAVAGARSVVSSLWSVNDAATSVLMERFYLHLWEKKHPPLSALRLAQLDVLRHPEWVEERVKKLADARVTVRGVGKASAPLPKGERQSPPAWWAAWQLSGDWR